MPSDEPLPTLKLVLLGVMSAGKSALVTRYCQDAFGESVPSIGLDLQVKKLVVRGQPYRVNIFDVSGRGGYQSQSTSFYRGTLGVILVYDITSRGSFLELERWLSQAKEYTVPNTVFYLVGTKLDLADESREVSTEEAAVWAEEREAHFCEVSALTGEDVRKPFVDVVDRILRDPELLSAVKAGKTPGTVAIGAGGCGGETGSPACSC